MLFAIMSVSLISCGDDDEIGGRDTLVGKWQCTWSEGYEKYANNPEYNDEWNEEGDFTVTFNEESSGFSIKCSSYSISVYRHRITTTSFPWKRCFVTKLEGDKLTIIYAYDDDSEDNEVYTVLKLTDSELILESSEKDSDYEYYDKSTFQKI